MNERSAKETRKVVGIKKDAFQQPNLENSSSANPQSIHQHHREKREYPYPLFIQDSEAHHHKNQPLLPQKGKRKEVTS